MAHSKPAARHAGGKTQRYAPPPRRALIGELPPRAPGFAGRADLARTVLGALVPGSSVLLVPDSRIAEGQRNWLGASGKTQLAASAAATLWRTGAIDLLVWVSATDQASVLAAYAEAAAAVTGADPPGARASAAGRFISWLARSGRPWLVVLDDVPDLALIDGLWPSGPSGRVVITTSRRPPPGMSGSAVIPVGLYAVREALGCLTERLQETSGQRQGAIDLIETAGREPLALAHACAVMVSSGMTCLEYRDFLVRRRQQMPVVPGEVQAAASATWTLSLDHAEVLLPGKLIRLTLMLIAVLDGHRIPGEVFGTPAVTEYLGCASAADVLIALQVLEQAGLVLLDDAPLAQVTPVAPNAPVAPVAPAASVATVAPVAPVAPAAGHDGPSGGGIAFLAAPAAAPAPAVGAVPVVPAVRISLAVQAAIRAVAPARLRDRAAVAAADALLDLWPATEPHPWTAAGLRANVESLWQSAGTALLAGGCHQVLIRAGCSLDDAGLTGPAAAFWLRLASVADEPGHPDAAAVTARLAAALLADGRGAEAAHWYRRVLAERTQVLVQGSPAISEARVSLGRALLAAGEGAEAITVLSEAALEAEKFLGPGSAGAIAAQDMLAAAYLAAGRSADAITLLERALADRERVAGPRDPATIASREELGAALLAAGRPQDAQVHTGRVLTDREAVLGKEHPDTIAARAAHAAAVHAAGRRQAALRLIERACADSDAVLGTDHPDTLTRRVSQAHVYYSVGRVGDATAILRDTLTRAARVVPADDPLLATIRQSLRNITGNTS